MEVSKKNYKEMIKKAQKDEENPEIEHKYYEECPFYNTERCGISEQAEQNDHKYCWECL